MMPAVSTQGATAIFWLAAGACLYAWVIFPLLLHLKACKRAPSAPPSGPLGPMADWPSVSVVIAAHDEVHTLPAKLSSLAALDYPTALCEWVIVSDGSTDGTAELLERAGHREPRLKESHYPEAAGKPTALNAAVSQACGDILVFMDARQQVGVDALRALVATLQDDSIGAASGELTLAADEGGDAGNVGLYWRYEKWIRQNESRLFSTTGATGALWAMRRKDWVPLPADALLDDFDTPVRLLARGLRTVFVPQAQVFDQAEASGRGEFRRKCRTLAGNFQSFARHPWLFDPRRNPVWWQFLSHKVARLLAPYAMMAALLSAALGGLAGDSTLLRAMLALQLTFYALGAAALLGWQNRLSRFAGVFLQMNAAAVVGAWRWLSGTGSVRWKRAAPLEKGER